MTYTNPEQEVDKDAAGNKRIRSGLDHGSGTGMNAADEPLHSRSTLIVRATASEVKKKVPSRDRSLHRYTGER